MINQIITFLTHNWWLLVSFGAFLLLFMYVGKAKGAKALSLPSLVSAINSDSVMMVDVRDAPKFREAHIRASVNHVASKASDLSNIIKAYENQNKQVVLVCENSRSSASLASSLKRTGHERIAYLKGGVEAWKSEGYPLSKI